MEVWIIATLCSIVTMCVGYLMGVYAPWLDKRQSLKTQQEQVKITAQKPQKQAKLQQTAGVNP